MTAAATSKTWGNGHSVMVMIPELVDLDANLDAPIPERFEALAEALRADHDEQQVRRIVRAVGGSGFNLNIFPNIACSMAFFRVLQPISVNETEIHHAVITMDGGPEIANQARLRPARTLPGADGLRHAGRLGGLGARTARGNGGG
ncbi:hypothetical protein [Lelliottia nimipressuralis]|uniref:hypothetical protein n=1 Tax=Lelliottia nimipressuralis TaxID=69220 RepID=UPI003D285B9D